MSLPLQIKVTESIKELHQLQRQYGELIGKRLQVLIEIKRHENKGGISKRDLSKNTGANHNSIVKWRRQYIEGGIDVLLKHGRKGFKPSILNKKEHEELASKLADPTNGLQGYKELLDWVNKEFEKNMKYTTLYEYARRHFKTKIKVARKSHIKKDKHAAEALKKTSVKK